MSSKFTKGRMNAVISGTIILNLTPKSNEEVMKMKKRTALLRKGKKKNLTDFSKRVGNMRRP